MKKTQKVVKKMKNENERKIKGKKDKRGMAHHPPCRLPSRLPRLPWPITPNTGPPPRMSPDLSHPLQPLLAALRAPRPVSRPLRVVCLPAWVLNVCVCALCKGCNVECARLWWDCKGLVITFAGLGQAWWQPSERRMNCKPQKRSWARRGVLLVDWLLLIKNEYLAVLIFDDAGLCSLRKGKKWNAVQRHE